MTAIHIDTAPNFMSHDNLQTHFHIDPFLVSELDRVNTF